MVIRRRLLDLLAARFSRRCVAVEAHAGYGKTTIVREAMDEHPSDWGDAEYFVRVAPRSPTLDDVLAGWAEQLGGSGTIDSVTDRVWARSPGHVMLWIDDVHLLPEEAGAALGELLDRLPDNGHLGLIGRSMPPVPLRRLELTGEVLHLGPDDLAFDDDEVAAFAALRSAEGDTDQVIDDVPRWPALLELGLNAGVVGIVEYLSDEVLTDLPTERLVVLRAIADADVVDQSLVDLLAPEPTTVEELVDGLPLVARHDDHVVLHDLLRDALRRRRPDDVANRGAEAVARSRLAQRDVLGAARQFAALRDVDGLRDVAATLVFDLHVSFPAASRRATVELISERLPRDPLAEMLVAVEAATTAEAGAIARLESAIEHVAAVGRADLEAVGRLYACELASQSGGLADVERHARRLTELHAGGLSWLNGIIIRPLFWSSRLTGQIASVLPEIDRQLAAATMSDEARAVAHFTRCCTLGYTGRVREALADVDRLSSELPAGLFANRLAGFVSIQRWMFGELTTEQLEATKRLVDAIESLGQAPLFVEGAGTTSIFCATVGDLRTAEELVDRGERAAVSLPAEAWPRRALDQARAVLDLLAGDEERAAARLDRVIPVAGPERDVPSHTFHLTAAMSYLLVPRTRAQWDAAPVSPDMTLRTETGRAMVRLRDGDPSAVAALPWDRPQLLRPWLIGPHLAEAAAAAGDHGDADAAALLAETPGDVRDFVDQAAANGRISDRTTTRLLGVLPRRPDHGIRLEVLGPIGLRRDDRHDVEVSDRARVRDLVAVLVHERRIARRRVAELLWPDKDEKGGLHNLRANLNHLLRYLEPSRSEGEPSWFVRVDGDDLVLDRSDLLRIDADDFEDLLADAERARTVAPRRALELLLSACALRRGDYLENTAMSDHVYFEALRLRGRFVEASIAAADLLLAIGEAAEAERLATAAAEAEPLNEPVQRVLASSLLTQRRVGAATEVMTRLLAQLDDVAIPPEPETARLVHRLGLSV